LAQAIVAEGEHVSASALRRPVYNPARRRAAMASWTSAMLACVSVAHAAVTKVRFFEPDSNCMVPLSEFPKMQVEETAEGSSSCGSYDAAGAPSFWNLQGKFYKVECTSSTQVTVSFPCESGCAKCDNVQVMTGNTCYPNPMEGGPMMKVDGCGAGMNVEFFNPGSSCATEYSVFPSMHVRETAFGSSSCSSYDAANAPEDWGMAGKFYKVECVSGTGPKVSFPCTDSSCGTCDMDVAMAPGSCHGNPITGGPMLKLSGQCQEANSPASGVPRRNVWLLTSVFARLFF